MSKLASAIRRVRFILLSSPELKRCSQYTTENGPELQLKIPRPGVSPTVDGYAVTLSSSIPIKSEALNKSIQPSPVHGSGMAAPSLVVAAWFIGRGYQLSAQRRQR